MPGRKFLPLLLLFILASALMTYEARSSGPAVTIKKSLRPLNGFVYGSLSAAEHAYSWGQSLFVRFGTGKKDKRILALEQEVSQLKRQLAGGYALFLENTRLRALLSLKEHNPKYVATANVISRGASGWQNTFVIDAGSREGVEKDMTVISPDGLAGKVLGVDRNYSRVLLINDVRFAAAVRIERLGQEAIFSGEGGPGNTCELKYITNDIKVQKGDILTTSGLDGLFPAGLKVGYVSGISTGEGFFRQVDVTPYADTMRLQEVTIIKR